MHENTQTREALLQFLSTIARPGQQVEDVNENENLIEAGVIDSLSLVHLILYLETEHGVDLRLSGVDPNEIGSITGMLAVIESQVGS